MKIANKWHHLTPDEIRAMHNDPMPDNYQDSCWMRVGPASVAESMTVLDCPICKRAIKIIDGR